MVSKREIILWPSEAHYARFRAICDDEQPITYAAFLVKLRANLVKMGRSEDEFSKVDPNPDQLAVWCRLHCGRVDANARARYIATMALLD